MSAAAPPAPPAWTGSRLTVDPEAVARNWATLAARTGAACGAVVKADAYGHGIEAVTPRLAAAGCRTFFVALQSEGARLRAILPEVDIYVLNGVFEATADAIRDGLRPFLSSPAALADWPADAPFALNVDTGMNRLGVSVPEALAFDGPPPALIASHFACADMPDHSLNAAQEAAFATARRAHPAVPASFANSAAILTRPQAHYDLVRPGIAMYGGLSAEGAAALEPTVRLEARVIQVRRTEAGETVGYGAAETMRRPSRVAIVSLGYADGYIRQSGGSDLTAGAPASVNGVAVRLVGRVSMDLIAVDVTDAPCERGDFVELIGPDVPVDTVAAHAGTIGYELLTGLSRRADRRVGPL
ncbi:alanine racemase [Acuticoccus sp. I52.16.1]|uniref:alanine racemase n=1 Tax=Acuticoccus sp. I52.16.1 TaxID=2928472 RepID=UPI001FD4F4AB|nr:alanine racemase [Acuticoccus sp. I52.16.1]UOM33871.1 alanine racemase [Acuticoccus sp. I52.16.1]